MNALTPYTLTPYTIAPYTLMPRVGASGAIGGGE